MSLVVVKSIKHGHLIKFGEKCDEEFIKWLELFSQLEELYEEMQDFDEKNELESSAHIALKANTLHAQLIEQWFSYLSSRRDYVDYEVSISGDYPSARISGEI